MVTENQSNKSCPKSLYFSLYFCVCFQFVLLGYRICYSSQEITQFYRIKKNRGWVKAKVVCRGGEGFEGVTTPVPR